MSPSPDIGGRFSQASTKAIRWGFSADACALGRHSRLVR